MPTFLHAADVHLDSPLHGLDRYEGAPAHRLRVATRDAFARMVDLAIELDVEFVVLAGDVYDGALRDDAACGLRLQAQLLRLREAEIPVVLAIGNHDAHCSFLRHVKLPDNVHVFATRRSETRSLPDLGVALHGQGYGKRHVTDDLAAGYPAAVPGVLNVGVLHTALDGRPGHDNYAPCTIDGLRARGYQYWALGHVHRREEVTRGDPWIVFPGNLQGRGVHEAGPKGCSLVTWKDQTIVSVEHRPVDVVRWADLAVDVGGAASLEDVLERTQRVLTAARVEADDRLLAARLRLVGAGAVHRILVTDPDLARAELRALANGVDEVWLAGVDLATRPELDLAALRARDGAVGALAAPIEGDELTARLEADLLTLRAQVPHELLPLHLRAGAADADRFNTALTGAQARLLGRLVGADDEESAACA